MPPKKPAPPTLDDALAALKKLASKQVRDGLSRFAIPNDKAWGVSVGAIRQLAKQLGKSHRLALELWKTDWYEPRLLAAFVDVPEEVTPAQMDRWIRDFDNWAICDTVCFHLFDRTPHRWTKIAPWTRERGEFAKRAPFALLWGLAVHDKQAHNQPFIETFPLIEACATDERNFVKKAVNMALRAIGKRNPALRAAACEVAQRLAESPHAAARWNGKNALRELRTRN